MEDNKTLSEEELKKVIAGNLVKFRKASKLTQLELAEKLLYSDKNISKWERGEATPDVVILKQLADMYGISVNDFLCDNSHIEIKSQEKAKKVKTKGLNRQQSLITLLSVSLVWLVAVVFYVILIGLFPSLESWMWRIYIIALMASSIVCLVFTSMWCTNLLNCIVVSILIWTTALTLFVCFPFKNMWLMFVIAVPVQIIDILWFTLRKVKKIKSEAENIKETNVDK